MRFYLFSYPFYQPSKSTINQTIITKIQFKRQMSSDLFLCFGKNCNEKCKPRLFEELSAHKQASQLQHKAIKLSKYHQKYKKFKNKMDSATQGLKALIVSVDEVCQQVIQRVLSLKIQLIQSINNTIDQYYADEKTSMVFRPLMQEVAKDNYHNLTCHKLRKIINIIEPVAKDNSFVQTQDLKLSKIRQQFQTEFKKNIKQVCQYVSSQKVLPISPSKIQSNFQITQSQIVPLKRLNSPSAIDESLIVGLKLQKIQSESKPLVKKKFKKKEVSQDTSKSIDITQNSEETSRSEMQPLKESRKRHQQVYRLKLERKATNQVQPLSKNQESDQSSQIVSSCFSKGSHSSNSESIYSSQFLSIHNVPTSKKSSSDILESKLSGTLNSDSDQEEGGQAQNQEQLNQTLVQIKQEIMSKAQPVSESEFKNYRSIQELENNLDEITVFSVRVEIVKIIYYSVLKKYIPKIKFIAGDSTGYALFFTNFCPGMKVGTVLDLMDCRFYSYMGSLQIVNNTNFRILSGSLSKIKANMKGVSLNKVLKQNLYYPLPDIRCNLIRHVAEKLKNYENNFLVSRMCVQIVKIIYDQKQHVFCYVGDSSGVMFAYLKVIDTGPLKIGDVVRLLSVRGCRGKQKNRYLNSKQQIMYLDGRELRCKVLPHRFDFLQVSDEVMTLK